MSTQNKAGAAGTATESAKPEQLLDEVTIRFVGDSGDGMQLTGSQFTTTTGAAGNDLMTFPDFPAEIRAPAGSLAGVSGFQIHFSSHNIYTPGDDVDVLVAMNPAALKSNLRDLKPGGMLIVNTDAFNEKNLSRVDFASNPLEDPALREKYTVILAPITEQTRRALEELNMPQAAADRCKNFFALGMSYFLFSREPQTTYDWLESKFKGKDVLIQANRKALQAGYNFAETIEAVHHRYEVRPTAFAPGLYRNITGNSALALGLTAAGQLADLPVVLGSYPITPASDILHELSRYKNFGVKTFQAEDEIAAAGAVVGAAFGGAIGVTTSSGPGITLKGETINLAVMTELPMIVVDVQRAGPSTGMPTKTEQTDLFQVMFGRNGESPIPVIAPSTPSDCFATGIEAVRIALKFMTPVVILSDAYLANGSEPWKVPDVADLAPIEHNRVPANSDPADFHVYARDPATLARRWPVPGTRGFEHRIGGIEKDALTGNVSYDPENHQKMVDTRAQKVAGIADFLPEQQVFGPQEGQLLVLSWGSVYGAAHAAVLSAQRAGKSVAQVNLRHINPFPRNLGAILKRFQKILLPELNRGQLALLIQGRFLIKVESLQKVKGRPFTTNEILSAINDLC